MGKLFTIASLLLFTASSYASPVKLTASGTVNQSDLVEFSTFQSCCADSTNVFNWQFESTFDFDNFFTPPYPGNQPEFLSESHQSSTVIDGVAAPAGFNTSAPYTGSHGLFSYESGPYVITQFQFTMGLAFEQATRFMITDNLYVREMSIHGYAINFYNSVSDALDPTKLTQALIADTSQFNTSYRFLLGDANNPNDNITIGSFWLTSLNHFDIDAVSVPEPSSAILLLMASLGLAFRRSYK